MRKLLLLAVFLFVTSLSFGQCPSSPIILTSQADIDNFTSNYPGCTMLQRSLWVGNSGSDITNLNGLNGITDVGIGSGGSGGGLFIESLLLTTLNGLNNLRTIGGTLGIENTNITNMQGLENLESIRGSINMHNNDLILNLIGLESIVYMRGIEFNELPALVNLEGIETLESVDGKVQLVNTPSFVSFNGLNNVHTIISGLVLSDCDNLTNLDILSSLTSLGYLHLFDNDNLLSLDGLSNVIPDNVFLQIIIRDNLSLTECAIQMVCENFDNPAPLVDVIIDNNAPGCFDNQEVMDACLLSTGDENIELLFNVFPNPTTDELHIATMNGTGFQKVIVHTISGIQLMESTNSTLDLSSLASGIYLAVVTTNQGTAAMQIVKQ